MEIDEFGAVECATLRVYYVFVINLYDFYEIYNFFLHYGESHSFSVTNSNHFQQYKFSST
jgi:hypothetical protein